ncbi:nodulation protein NodH [Rhodobacter sp. NTK016B]|uniref:sulfotransferase family 2 domain-containing protein n=1 Tax=Rhodobacter sp. NTK016B TaxID=2759676 RepID=UPI001A8EB711|nr:sulfotransferase family 2 domain-containing protein [Rhodobacter sp. NTK016B]MBN8292241.1 nodulation protein NodH [Rhodobacter sp. NTK016B]
MAFDYFVILAEMRTGSNLLESNLNAFDGIECHGELFNTGFINTPGTESYLGVSFAQREADPWSLMMAVRDTKARMPGFRLFHDHDPRIWDHVLHDTACAKIVLTRNPLDSYVSRKIAAATNQWKLGDVKNRRQTQVSFDADEFETHLSRLQSTQIEILNTLQTTGQSAFYIGYDDANDLEVLNGLARWLGLASHIDRLPRALKKQNPEPLDQKLSNPGDVAKALARIDRFDLGRTPNFEVRRGPMLDAAQGGVQTPLLFLPLRGAPETEVIRWMAALDRVTPDALATGFDEGRLHRWRQGQKGQRSFTVLRHPLKRAYDVFTTRIATGEVEPVREHMIRLFGSDPTLARGSLNADRDAFKAYLKFCRASISGQTGLQPWPIWATQAALLDGYAKVISPDLVLREEDLAEDLPHLARRMGHPSPPEWSDEWSDQTTPAARPLSEIRDDEITRLVREAYGRDFDTFGFADL